jgi:hypothetical protein
MSSSTRRIAAVIIALFLGIAVLCVDRGRAAGARRTGLSTSRSAEKSNAPLPERKTLKRGLCIDDETSLSDLARIPSRNLSYKERRAEIANAGFGAPSFPGFVFTSKVSTSVFLSVLNL